MKVHKFKTSQDAWEGLNEYFLNNQVEILENGGGRYGGQMVSYDHLIYIDRAWVLPDFDFGNTFGYRKQKWSGLLSNYVDREQLEDLKKRVLERENKKSRHYNISMVFHNKHGHGKNCLMSITFSRRQKPHNKVPIISFNMRSSEITKRLLLDLLLVQRIIEYIYGLEVSKECQIIMFATNIYQNAEAFTMFDTYKSIKGMVDVKKSQRGNWQNKILEILKKFKKVDVDQITMKVHKRCVRQLQRPEGIPLSGDRPMLAKDLKINI